MRRDAIFCMQTMQIEVEYSHHDAAPSRHGIDLRCNKALKMAGIVMTYRTAVKEIGRQGVCAAFMPKQIDGENGSGMHMNQSLFNDGEGSFFGPNDEFRLSAAERHHIAGSMKHARTFPAVTKQWVNSCKRLVPGPEAPVHLSRARRNPPAIRAGIENRHRPPGSPVRAGGPGA